MLLKSIKGSIKLFISDIIHKLNYFTCKSDFNVNEIVDGLHRNGFFVIHDFISSEQSDNLKSEAYTFLENRRELISIESNGSDYRVYNIDKYTPIFNIKKVTDISNKIFKKFSFLPLKDNFVLLGNIKAIENNLGSGGGWHRDSPFMHQFKTIVYLSDVDINSGPFEYIPGTHKYSNILKYSKFLNLSVDSFRFSESQILSLTESKVLPEPVKFLANKGTIIFVNTRGLHRGMPIIDGDRVAITNYHLTRKNNDFK